MRQGWPKFLFRRVAEQFVPQEVSWRTGQEHVGWQFNQELLERKKTKIIEQINVQYDTLVRFLKPEFICTGLKKDAYSAKSAQMTLQVDVVGLTLWMYNNQELEVNKLKKKDYSKPTLSILGKVSELTACGSCGCSGGHQGGHQGGSGCSYCGGSGCKHCRGSRGPK